LPAFLFKLFTQPDLMDFEPFSSVQVVLETFFSPLFFERVGTERNSLCIFLTSKLGGLSLCSSGSLYQQAQTTKDVLILHYIDLSESILLSCLPLSPWKA
jgi:hypothetical protein